MLHDETGIRLNDGKVALVYSRLSKRLRALGLESFRQYCALVEQDDSDGERQRMLAALTTNVTRFFREPHHFTHLAATAAPLIARARRGEAVRIWSAGCATGEEPYSIGLTLLDLAPDLATLDVKILATDVNTEVLATGRTGAYSAHAVREVSPAQLKRWFEPQRRATDDGGWRISPALRDLVAFRSLNLFDPWPMRRSFDAIFCRNVVIYFDAEAQRGLWPRFAAALRPQGRLYIGHSERLPEDEERFETEALTTYRLKDQVA